MASSWASSLNSSVRATKSVSQLTSISAPIRPPLLQDLESLLHIAIDFNQGIAAVHDSGAALLA
jgi:hypothetical protein